MVYKTIDEINRYEGTTINPMNSPDEVFELYSVPSFDNDYPEIIAGAHIGSSKVTVQKNDVLICKINPRINRVWVVKHHTEHPLLASSEWIVVRNPDMDADYLRWYFSSPTFRVMLNSEVAGIGGSLTRAQPKRVAQYTVPVRSLQEQKNIAAALNRVEELICLRKQQITKLDEVVKARFVEMFGDPVTNEKNWPRLTLGDICEIGSSKRVFEKDYVPSGIPFFRTKEIVELSKGNPISTELFITEEHFAELKKSYGAPKKDDLLISAVGTIGTIWIVSGDFEFYFKDGNLIQIKSSPTFNSIFMKYLLDELIANYKKEMSTGTAYSALTIAGLKKMLVYNVPLEFQKKFAAFVEQTDKSKLTIQHSLAKLETLKKSLMQKYFG